MGRKPFVSKSGSTKFDLVYRSREDPNAAPEREWIESSRRVGIGRPDAERMADELHNKSTTEGTLSSGHPLAWLERSNQPTISEERRREIMALGFPDDGYDYLKHVRQGHDAMATSTQSGSSAGQDASERYGGPSVFVPAPFVEPPAEDYKAIDASRLTVHQAAEDEDEAALLAGGASGFSRELHTVRRRYQNEIDDMELMIRQFESLDDVHGDLLEDFVLSATEVPNEHEAGSEFNRQPATAASDADTPDVEGGSELEDETSSGGEEPHEAAPSESKSFASTYWRPERTDRKGNLSAIDERFEQLALEYDSDEIGELDHYEGHPSLRGAATTDQFSRVMDTFLAVHNTQDHAHDSGQAYDSAAQTASCTRGSVQNGAAASGLLSSTAATDAEKATALAAVARAKEQLLRLQQEDESSGSEDDGETMTYLEERPRENWDCESVLTSCSTAYNHPKKLDEMPSKRCQRQRGQIQLSNKTGLPILSRKEQNDRSEVADNQVLRPDAALRTPVNRSTESKTEKRERKEAVKEAKREARANKKELKLMFRDALQRQQKQCTPNISVTSLA